MPSSAESATGWRALQRWRSRAACTHPHIVGAFKPRELPEFRWVNTVLGNLKTMPARSFHSLGYRKYADNYLAGIAYRFDRGFDLRGLVAPLIVDVALYDRTKKTKINMLSYACCLIDGTNLIDCIKYLDWQYC